METRTCWFDLLCLYQLLACQIEQVLTRKVTFSSAKSRKMTTSLHNEQRIKAVNKKRVKNNLNIFRPINDLSQFNQNIIIKMKTGSTIEQTVDLKFTDGISLFLCIHYLNPQSV